MDVHNHFFVNAEISLIVEALRRAAKRQEAEAKYLRRNGQSLGMEHLKKARAMQRLIAKLQPLTGLKGEMKA